MADDRRTHAVKPVPFFKRLREMWGVLPGNVLRQVEGEKCIWAHAVSVGEAVATSSIIKEITKIMPNQTILVSVTTVTGYAMAKQVIPEATGIIYFPLDLPWVFTDADYIVALGADPAMNRLLKDSELRMRMQREAIKIIDENKGAKTIYGVKPRSDYFLLLVLCGPEPNVLLAQILRNT